MTTKNKAFATLATSKGQSMIEALAVAITLISFISVLAAVFYFSLVHVGMSYLLHEHLVCESTQGQAQCREEFLERVRPFLIFARIDRFHSERRRNKITNRLVLQMPMQRVLRLEKNLELYR